MEPENMEWEEIQEEENLPLGDEKQNETKEESTLKWYQETIPVKKLTEEAVRELVIRASAEDTKVAAKATEALIESLLRQVVKLAWKYVKKNPGVDIMDLIQAGNEVLPEIVRKFDPDKGAQLSTFAMNPIRGAIRKYLKHSGELDNSHSPSLNDPIGKDEDTMLIDLIEDTDSNPLDQLIHTEAKSFAEDSQKKQLLAVKKVIADRLTEEEATVFKLVVLKNKPYTEIAENLGVSDSKVKGIFERALRKIRTFVAQELAAML